MPEICHALLAAVIAAAAVVTSVTRWAIHRYERRALDRERLRQRFIDEHPWTLAYFEVDLTPTTTTTTTTAGLDGDAGD